MKRAILFGMIGLWILGLVNTGASVFEKPNAYHALIKEAEEYESKEIYIRAIQSYKEALLYQPESVDLKMRIARAYLSLGDETSYINQCQGILEEHGYPVDIATSVTDYYLEKERAESAIDLIQQTLKAHPNNPEMMERFEKVRYTFKMKYLSYEEILPIYNGCAVFLQEGKYGLISKSGDTVLRNYWDQTGVWSDDQELIPVMENSEAYYVNRNGYRYEIPFENQKVEWLGSVSDNIAAAKINGNYGYIDSQFHELCEFQWDGATGIADGFGAVQKNGKWALIDEELKLISDYIYDEVKTTPYGFGSIQGKMFVMEDGSWRLVNQKGETVGSEVFEDAVPFCSSLPTAVKKNGKWGFINTDGSWFIEPQYEAAEGFSDGLAPVLVDGKWGFINEENRLVIEAEFSGAHSFYGGVAPVRDGDVWTMIELNVR